MKVEAVLVSEKPFDVVGLATEVPVWRRSGFANWYGIDYDLIQEQEPNDALPPETWKPAARPPTRRRPAPQKQARVEKIFNVRVRRRAVVEITMPVEARSKSDARTRAVEKAKAAPLDLSKARITSEVVKVESE